MRETFPRKPWHGDNASFVVLPRKKVYQWCRYKAPKAPFAIISIFDSDKESPLVPMNHWMRGIVKMRFDDIEPADGIKYLDRVLFTEEMAKTIWDFVLERKAIGVKMWVVHCEMGICRSSAVAAAISFYLNGENSFFFDNYHPNEWVYNLMMATMPKPTQRENKNEGNRTL